MSENSENDTDQNYTVAMFPDGSLQRQFVSELRKIYITYKKCHGLTMMLVDCFEKSKDPYFASLSIAFNSFDYHQSKSKSLTYTVLEEFNTWIQPKINDYHHLLNNNIKMNAFKVASGQKNRSVSLFIVEIYKLKSDNSIFINYINEMLSGHKYKEACELVKILGLEEHFNIYDFLVPLFFQDKLSVICAFLENNKDYQIAFITFLDSLVIEGNLSARISKMISDLNMPEVPIHTQSKLFNIKSLTKFIKRLLKEFDLPKDFAPNFSKRSEHKTVSYLVYKRFTEKTLTDEVFRELVIDLVKDNDDVCKEFLIKLTQVGAYNEIVYWCQVLNIPDTEMPLSVKDNLKYVASADTEGKNNEDDWEEVIVEEFHTLLLPSSSITFICSEELLLSFLEEEFLNVCSEVQKIDCKKVEKSNHEKESKKPEVVKVNIPLCKDIDDINPSPKEEVSTVSPSNKSLLVASGTSVISGVTSIVSGGASIVSGGVNLVSGAAHLACSGASVVSGGASLVSTGVSLATGRTSLVRTGATLLTSGASIASGSTSLVTSGVSFVAGTAAIVSGGVSLVSGGASVVSGAANLVAGGVAKAIQHQPKTLPNPTESYLFPKATLRGPGNCYLVALDCEWKPSTNRSKTEISLLQLATPTSIYILDMMALNAWQNHCDQLVSNLFNNQEVLKIGFSMHTDMKYLSSYFNCAFSQFGCNLLDLADLWTKLTTEYNFQFPFTDDTQENSFSLSRLVFLCLGKYLDKKERFSNWELRPLRESQIQYAALDAFCLIEIYNVIRYICIERELPFDDIVNELVIGYRDKYTKKKKKQEEGNSEDNKIEVLNEKAISVDTIGFVCDKMLTGVGKHLRRCGISVDLMEVRTSIQDLTKKALLEDKYILVRGNPYKKIIEIVPPNKVYKFKSNNAESQLIEVLNYFNFIIRNEDIFSRCLDCNGTYMAKCSKEDVMSWCNNPLVEVNSNESTQMKYAPGGFEDDNYCHDDYDNFCDDYDDDTYEPEPTKTIYKPVTTKYGCPIKVEIPDIVLKQVNTYYLCESCGKIFWNEGQFDHILGTINSAYDS